VKNDDPDIPRAHPSNRRRLAVFLPTLIVALVASLAYVWLRPAEYRATARIEITPATTAAPAAPTAPIVSAEGESARPFLTEVQILTSRPVLEEVATRLARGGQNPSQFGPDPIAGMQEHLAAVPVPQTNVVELVATGRDPIGVERLRQLRLLACFYRARACGCGEAGAKPPNMRSRRPMVIAPLFGLHRRGMPEAARPCSRRKARSAGSPQLPGAERHR